MGGALGGGIGAEISNILIYLITTVCNITLTESVEGSLTALIIAAIGYIGVYFAPANVGGPTQ
jgi:hypothetical protein